MPKKMTEPRTVKNFLVVVTMEQGRGPNSETHMKMKNYKEKQGFTSQLCYDFLLPGPERWLQRSWLAATEQRDVSV